MSMLLAGSNLECLDNLAEPLGPSSARIVSLTSSNSSPLLHATFRANFSMFTPALAKRACMSGPASCICRLLVACVACSALQVSSKLHTPLQLDSEPAYSARQVFDCSCCVSCELLRFLCDPLPEGSELSAPVCIPHTRRKVCRALLHRLSERCCDTPKAERWSFCCVPAKARWLIILRGGQQGVRLVAKAGIRSAAA